MIPRKDVAEHTPTWKKEFDRSLHLAELLKSAENKEPLTATTEAAELSTINTSFPIRINSGLVQRLAQSDEDTRQRVLRQYLPHADELKLAPNELQDPVGDVAASKTQGLIHKYQHRVLLITSDTCPIHCRYCFRRDYPYPQANSQQIETRWSEALDYIRADQSLNEVILSGGDPLSLDDKKLAQLIDALQAIDHIKTLRLHTKYPSITPSRITPELIQTLSNSRFDIVMVLHINHAAELSNELSTAVSNMRLAGIHCLNQSVLLQGVNDDIDCLEKLSRQLFAAGILPYYLHLLDRAKGTAHFEVSQERANELMQAMKQRLPGYLVPKLAREIAGADSKQY